MTRPVRYFRDLLRHKARINAFRRAIETAVRPGDHVLDLGTGLGTYACFAVRAGAGRVWAVDGDPIVHVARAVAVANGYEDRIEFRRGWFPEIELPTRPDVIIFEDFPPRLLDARTWELLAVLHDRVAGPDTRWVPVAATMFAAPVTSAALFDLVAPLGDDERAHGVDWRLSRSYSANEPIGEGISPDALVASPAAVAHVEFVRPPAGQSVGGEAVWTLEQAATIHGLAYWFDLHLADGGCVSNAPGAPSGSWRQLFLPCDPPLVVDAGTRLEARVTPDRLPHGVPGRLGWTVRAGARVVRGHEFAAQPAGLEDLLAGSPDGVPVLNRRGARVAAVLRLVDGRRSVREIASALRRVYPELSDAAALRTVAEVLRDRVSARAADEKEEP